MVFDSEGPFGEASEFEGTEVDVPAIVVDFFEANGLASRGLSDVDPFTVPSDSTVSTDEADLVVGRVVDGGGLRRHLSEGTAISGGRRLLVEGFVRRSCLSSGGKA